MNGIDVTTAKECMIHTHTPSLFRSLSFPHPHGTAQNSSPHQMLSPSILGSQSTEF